jgi:hypothetical protein
MKTKPAKRPIGIPAIESDELHQAKIDACIARNREVLSESIRRSRQELAVGVCETRTIDEIIADGRKRRRAAS